MRQFPREIEADLLFRGVDVFDWHRGEMSSRRLLVLIDALPDDSAYWRERRDGDWRDQEYVLAAAVNELRLLRADQAAIHAQKEMRVEFVRSPAQTEESVKDDERFKAVREHIMSQLAGK